MHRYKVMLFDLDGTLLDTLDDIADAANWALAQCGMPTRPRDDYRMLTGRGPARMLRDAAPDDMLTPTNFEGLKRLYLDRYAQRSRDKTRPYPGAEDALRSLRRDGAATCVISNKPDDEVKDLVSHFFGYDLFDLVAGSSDRYPNKPDPTLALSLIDSTGASPSDAVLVGDTPIDLATAAAAGIDFIGAAWGFRGEKVLRDAGASVVASSFIELVDIARKASR